MEHLKEVSATLRVRNAWIPVSPGYRVVFLDMLNLGKTENWLDCMFPLGVLVLLFIFSTVSLFLTTFLISLLWATLYFPWVSRNPVRHKCGCYHLKIICY